MVTVVPTLNGFMLENSWLGAGHRFCAPVILAAVSVKLVTTMILTEAVLPPSVVLAVAVVVPSLTPVTVVPLTLAIDVSLPDQEQLLLVALLGETFTVKVLYSIATVPGA